jgi:hypothetical protein
LRSADLSEIPYGAIAMCAQDFLSSLSERPKIVRILLRFVFGKHAYHEFILLADCFSKTEMYMNYELDESEYHHDKYRNDFSDGFKKY